MFLKILKFLCLILCGLTDFQHQPHYHVEGKSLTSVSFNIAPPPKGCRWQKFYRYNTNSINTSDSGGYNGDNSDLDNINNGNEIIYILICKLRTISSVDSLFTNLTVFQTDRIKSVRFECNDILFFESSLNRYFLSALRHLSELEIEYCKIKYIPGSIFEKLRDLKTLNVRTHNTDWSVMNLELHSETFRGLTDLNTLNLADNNIWSLPTEVFCPLYSLKHLNLNKNCLTDIGQLSFSDWGEGPQAPGKACNTVLELLDLSSNGIQQLPDNGLSALRSLKHLLLQDNAITILADRSFVGLQSLEILNISSNRLSTLPPELLQSPRNLKQLYLRNNTINVLAPGLLEGLDHLEVLDLSQNQLTSEWINRDTFFGLIRLVILNLNNNLLRKIDANIFQGLSNLQILNLESNAIDVIGDNAFRDLKNLHSLTLSNNQLKYINEHLFSELYVLNLLFLESNQIIGIHHRAFENLTNLNDLSLNDNQLTEIPNGLQHLHFLKSLDLGKNHIKYINASAFDGLEQLSGLRLVDNLITNLTKDSFISLSSINVLNLSSNKIKYIDPNAFSSNPTIKAIRLDDNELNDISMVFKSLNELAWLNVSDNNIVWFNYNHLPESIEWLDIHKNNIIELENQLSALPNMELTQINRLKMLDVSYNQIKQIVDINIPDSIEILYVNNNNINYIGPGTFLRKLKLQKVILYGNKIKYLDIAAFAIIASSNSSSIIGDSAGNVVGDLIDDDDDNNNNANDLPEFFIGNNPIHCNCKMEWLQRINELNHLRQYPRVLDLDQIFCTMEHNHIGGADHMTATSQLQTIDYNANVIPDVNRNDEDNEDNPNANNNQLVLKSLIDLKSEEFLCHYSSHCFALCHCCDFNACDCKMTCPRNCNCYHDHLWNTNIVDCGNSTYTQVPERIPMDATSIFLDGNNLGNLISHMFIGKKKLEILYLNSSNIESIHNRTFNGIHMLKILHLESNDLREIRGYEFDQLTQLMELYLHNNLIERIIDEGKFFESFDNLKVLTLYNNFLVNFQPWLGKKTQMISIEKFLIFNSNKWTNCNCIMIKQLIEWKRSFKGQTDIGQLKCDNDKRSLKEIINNCKTVIMSGMVDRNGEAAIGDDDDESDENTLNMNVITGNENNAIATPAVQRTILLNGNLSNTNLIGGNYVPILAAVLVTLIGAGLLIGLICAYRQDVRIWAHAKYGIRLFKDPTIQAITPQPDDENVKLYDTYIIYSQNDTDFCTQTIATELHHLGFKLALYYDVNHHNHQQLHHHNQHHIHPHSMHPHQQNTHLQHHPSTTYLIDTLQCQMDVTKKLVLIISMNFLQNEWSQPQFRIALQTIIENIHPISLRKRKIIIILTIPKDIITMDPFLLMLLQQCSVIFWGEKRFWEKLRFLLPDINASLTSASTVTGVSTTSIRKKNNGTINVNATSSASTVTITPSLTSQSTPTTSITSTHLKKHTNLLSRSPQLRYTPAPTTNNVIDGGWCPIAAAAAISAVNDTTSSNCGGGNNTFNCTNDANSNCNCNDSNILLTTDCNNITAERQIHQLQSTTDSQTSPSQTTSHTEDESSCASSQIYEPPPLQNYTCRSNASSLGHVYSTIPETPQMGRNTNIPQNVNNNNNNTNSGRAYFV